MIKSIIVLKNPFDGRFCVTFNMSNDELVSWNALKIKTIQYFCVYKVSPYDVDANKKQI